MLNSSRRGLLAPNLVDRRLEEAPGTACRGYGAPVKFPRLLGWRKKGEKREGENGLAGREERGRREGLPEVVSVAGAGLR